MNGMQFVNKLDQVLQWITRLVQLNFLWLLFTAIGLFAAGVFPATAAVYGICRKWIMGELDVKIWPAFKSIYRAEFGHANLLGWILTMIGAVLYLNYRLISLNSNELFFIVPFAFYFMLFFYLLVCIWSFPLLVHYKTSWKHYLKNAMIIGLTKIHYTIFCGGVTAAIIYFSLSYPGIIPFFTISTICFSSMWIAMQVFGGLDKGVITTRVTN